MSVELDYDAAFVLVQCTEHGLVKRAPLDDDVGVLLVRFFRDHQSCSLGATFEVDDRITAPVNLKPTVRPV